MEKVVCGRRGCTNIIPPERVKFFQENKPGQLMVCIFCQKRDEEEADQAERCRKIRAGEIRMSRPTRCTKRGEYLRV